MNKIKELTSMEYLLYAIGVWFMADLPDRLTKEQEEEVNHYYHVMLHYAGKSFEDDYFAFRKKGIPLPWADEGTELFSKRDLFNAIDHLKNEGDCTGYWEAECMFEAMEDGVEVKDFYSVYCKEWSK